MILAQLLFLTLLSLVFSTLFRGKIGKGIRITEKFLFITLFLSGILLIFNPKIMRGIADFFNITRGVDLLFYLYIVTSIWIILRTHIRLNLIDKNIKEIISNMALNNTKKED